MTTNFTTLIRELKLYYDHPNPEIITFCRDLLEGEPENTEYLTELAKALYFEKKHDESIAKFEKVIRLSDDGDEIINAWGFIGLNMLEKGEFKSALDYLNMVLRQRPKDELALTYKLIVLEKQRDWIGFVECAERIMEVNPENRGVLFKLINCCLMLEDWQKTLDWIGNTKGLEHTKAMCLYNLERYDECMEISKDLKSAQGYFLMGKCLEKKSKITKAVRYLQKSFELNLDTETLIDIAEIYYDAHAYGSALTFYSKALSFDSENEYALERMSECYIMTQDHDLAIMHAEKLIEQSPHNVDAYLIMCDAYIQKQRFEKAEEIIEKGIENNPESAILWLERGGMHLCGDCNEVDKSIQMAIELEPSLENFLNAITWFELIDEEGKRRKYYDQLKFYYPAFHKTLDELSCMSWRKDIN